MFIPFFPLYFFPLFLNFFLSQTLKIKTFKSSCLYGENYKETMHAQGKAQAQKRPEKSFSLSLRLFFP